jgi:hypothetical protein
MNRITVRKLLLFFFLLVSSTAHAVTVTAKVVADDYYKVFTGDGAGTSLTFVGGSGSNLWFGQGAAFNFDVAPGQYIYVAAWDSASFGPPHMWIGEFDLGGPKLLSNTTDWVGKFDASIKDPSTAQVQALAQSGSWAGLAASMPNGTSPYGSLIGGSAASMIWTDAFDGSSASENGYALFRTATAVVAVPEPETYAMLIAGLGLLGFAARRRKQDAA